MSATVYCRKDQQYCKWHGAYQRILYHIKAQCKSLECSSTALKPWS